ncbi:TPA: flagellar motor switch phosphatase FliY [Bacillus pseudomycoides]|nr:flagellar motor switch phosphatase FliY [Bacillus pseudomycoides]
MSEQHRQGESDTLVLEKDHSHLLTQQERDILGEIANISFGSASTILSTLLNRQVSITAPHVEVVELYDARDVEVPHVVLNIHFIKGLEMENLLVIKQDVALAIADLMMMGSGKVDANKELSELELSAVKEAMNQMMGFAATSMSEFFKDVVDMSPPTIQVVTLKDEIKKISDLDNSGAIIKIAFDLKIDDLVNSKLVQIVSIESAKGMINKILQVSGNIEEKDNPSEIEVLNQEEKDALGEIANISIGSASTVLSTLLNQPVSISIPKVEIINAHHYDRESIPFVIINVDFIEGLQHENMFIFSKEVALTMLDLMMMGNGEIDLEQDLTDLELSGVKEIMNQMMGHAATAMSEVFGEKMDISTPRVKFVTIQEEMESMSADSMMDELAQITFQIEVGDLLDLKMYQILPIPKAKGMVKRLIPQEVNEVEVKKQEATTMESLQRQNHASTTNVEEDILQNVEVDLKFVFGNTMKTIEDILGLHESETVVLDESIEEPIQIYANNVLIAYGELVNVDGFFGVKVIKSL